ncbi:hypothetical protein FBT96_19830 [Rhodobacter capsulatus]|uniref:HTH luxR-type domain-containing protein n=1 Tax=Rhodobacter capsulatus TaxID=1061 RepID=A0A4U1JJP6_RHOCA|nr:LuxR C-terminal-related transcriptional regulator [Rhodobacter capsulatus]TKD12961.1 hypothetical protein FBT96_19830 [Rhodobacter capsulatus]
MSHVISPAAERCPAAVAETEGARIARLTDQNLILRTLLARQIAAAEGMAAVLRSLDLPILILGHDLRLRDFTRAAMPVWDIGPADLGRRAALPGPRARGPAVPRAELAAVCRSGQPRTRLAAGRDGALWRCNLQPHLGHDGLASGVIVLLLPQGPTEDGAEGLSGLTPRQRQVMELVLAGHPSKNIAVDLGISQRTVENHRAAVMRQTGATSLPALARIALGSARSTDCRCVSAPEG